MDLDKRIGAAGSAPPSGSGPAPQTTTPPPAAGAYNAAAPLSAPVAASGATPRSSNPGEADAYRAAYALVQGRQFDQAVIAFNSSCSAIPMAFTPPMRTTGWVSCIW
ncbi:MAG: hypothetical protein IPG64_16450 [Haliea sp.]|nr:hypothetical protein [Haliea sp.]